MNKQTGNMYDFVTHTSNPIKGLCPHECSYCYMNSIYQRYKSNKALRLDDKEFSVSYGKGNFIFIGSSTDMFAKDIRTDWIKKVYDKCLQYEENSYLFQSKNPSRFLEPELVEHPLMQVKDRVYFATTLETNREYSISKAECMEDRVKSMEKLTELGYSVMITMEPIMDFDIDVVLDMLRRVRPFQVNIGCNTSSVQLQEPSRDKIIALIQSLRTFTTVKLKSNSSRILGDSIV